MRVVGSFYFARVERGVNSRGWPWTRHPPGGWRRDRAGGGRAVLPCAILRAFYIKHAYKKPVFAMDQYSTSRKRAELAPENARNRLAWACRLTDSPHGESVQSRPKSPPVAAVFMVYIIPELSPNQPNPTRPRPGRSNPPQSGKNVSGVISTFFPAQSLAAQGFAAKVERRKDKIAYLYPFYTPVYILFLHSLLYIFPSFLLSRGTGNVVIARLCGFFKVERRRKERCAAEKIFPRKCEKCVDKSR